MKTLRESFFKNMGVGVDAEKKRIEQRLAEILSPSDLKKCVINDNLEVDVKGNIEIRDCEEFGVQFGRCKQFTICCGYSESPHHIKTLKGIPIQCTDLKLMHCDNLKTLDYIPDTCNSICINSSDSLEYIDKLPSRLQELILLGCNKLKSIKCPGTVIKERMGLYNNHKLKSLEYNGKVNRLGAYACPISKFNITCNVAELRDMVAMENVAGIKAKVFILFDMVSLNSLKGTDKINSISIIGSTRLRSLDGVNPKLNTIVLDPNCILNNSLSPIEKANIIYFTNNIKTPIDLTDIECPDVVYYGDAKDIIGKPISDMHSQQVYMNLK